MFPGVMLSRDLRRLSGKKKGAADQDRSSLQKRPLLYGFSIVILVIIVISFVGAPIVGRMSQQGSPLFGYYSGREIRFIPGNYFSQQYDSIAENIRDSDQTSDLYTQLYQAWRSAFNQTVFHTAVLVETEQSGLWVSDNKVTDSLVEYGPYSVGGVFDPSVYSATSRTVRTRNLNLRREELTQAQYLQDLFGSNLQSSAEKEFILEMASKERRFSFVSWDFSDFPEERVLAYGRENEEKFRRAKLSRITITSSENEANRVRDMAVSGSSSYEDLARSYSKGFYADKGGDMGWQYYYQIRILFNEDAPADSIMALGQGDISPVYLSGTSWIFFRCDGESVVPELEDQEVLDDIRSYIESNELGVIEEYFIGEAEEFRELSQSEGFIEASIEKRLFPPKETNFFPVNYGGAFAQRALQVAGEEPDLLAAASYNEEFYERLFSLGIDGVSEPILLSDLIVVVKMIEERTAPEDDQESLASTLEYLSSMYLDQELSRFVIDDDLLVDNFQETFSAYIATPQ